MKKLSIAVPRQERMLIGWRVQRKAMECPGDHLSHLRRREVALVGSNKDNTPAGRHWQHQLIPQRW